MYNVGQQRPPLRPPSALRREALELNVRNPYRFFEAGDYDTLSGEELVSVVSRRASPPTARSRSRSARRAAPASAAALFMIC